MSAPISAWVIAVLMQEDLLALNRATGIIRRRNLPVGSVALGPASRTGMVRLTCVVSSDRPATDRMANALRKMMEVREVSVYPEAECARREHALVRVRVSPTQLARLLDVVSLFEATVVEESPPSLLIEATGTEPFMTSFLRALEPFGILDLARGGTLVLPPPSVSGAAGSARPAAPTLRVAATIPA
jgi:acetolactate synthase-1/3 small subunit